MFKVLVLLSTYNGDRYLEDLLRSLFTQENVDLNVFVRDDGSSDKTIEILEKWSKNNKLKYYIGANKGPAGSFFDLISIAPLSDYYAFCDQDDIWLPDKMISAIRMLSQSNREAIYFSQTQLVDSNLNELETIKISPKLTFEESLITSCVTGCTLVINHKMRELLSEFQPNNVLMHDSWIYKLCIAVDGDVFFDPSPHILYRQHENNVVGLSYNKKRIATRRWKNLINKNRERSREAKLILDNYSNKCSNKKLTLLKRIVNYRTSIYDKSYLLFNREFIAKSFSKTLFLKISILINRF